MKSIADIIDEANDAGNASRAPDAPVLSARSTVVDLCAWLQWCDPNGVHTAQAWADERTGAIEDKADPEDVPYTLTEAWEQIRRMLEDA